MSPANGTDCAQCKAAPAVIWGIYVELDDTSRARPWCLPCALEAVNVLVPASYNLTLSAMLTPPALLVCEYGEECGRMAVQGRRHCTDHLRTIEEVYAGKESGARVHADDCETDDYGTNPMFDVPAGATRGGYDR